MSFKRALFLIIAVVALLVGSSATAGAQDNPDYTAPAPTVEVTSPAPTQSLRSTPARAAAGAPLAVTGTDALQLLVVGGLLVAGGAAILTVRRRAVS